jgi:hypothetical protein
VNNNNNNNNNNMAIDRISSLNGNNRFIDQNNFQYYPPPSPFQQERSNIITGPGQTPITEPIIPPVTRTTPSQQTAPAPAPQEQEQKKEIIRPLNTCKTKSCIYSIFKSQDFLMEAREKGEDNIIAPPEPSFPPRIITTSYKNRNNSKESGGAANNTVENTKEEEKPEEYNHNIEEYPSSKPNLLVDNDYGVSHSVDYVYFLGGKWVIKRDSNGDIIDWYKVIREPILEARYNV